MRAIRSIHWDVVAATGWMPRLGQGFAVWPSPVDHDECFRLAGFSDFDDSTQAWDDEFEVMNATLVDVLVATAGAVSVHEGPQRLRRPSWRERLRGVVAGAASQGPPVADRLEAAARDDQFPPCVLYFGDGPTAAVRASDGHPLWHIWVSEAASRKVDVPRLLRMLAADRPVTRTRLQWIHLVPGPQGR